MASSPPLPHPPSPALPPPATLAALLAPAAARPAASQPPVYYCPAYNISVLGIEKLHPFDAAKYGKVRAALQAAGVLPAGACVPPLPLSPETLAAVHTPRYLASLTSSATIARVMEVPLAGCLPSCLLSRSLLAPMALQASGTVAAAHAACARGVGFNLGGGFHHASADAGHGFCAYADITLAARSLQAAFASSSSSAGESGRRRPLRTLIVDLDAHQGDGVAKDLGDDPNVCIFDAYTPGIFPNDAAAAAAVHVRLHYAAGDTGARFLAALGRALPAALEAFSPDVVIYNAGSDILEGDPLSGLAISPAAVLARDEAVFRACGYVETARGEGAPPLPPAARLPSSLLPSPGAPPRRFVPVVMLLSGGYQKKTARVIADSLLRLHGLFGVLDASWAPPAGWTRLLD